MPNADDIRKYAGSAVGQSREALGHAGTNVHAATDRLATLIERAPKPSTAALGTLDLAFELLSHRAQAATRRVEHLPADYAEARSATRSRLSKTQEDALVAIAKAQEDAQARLAALRARVPAQRPATLPKMDPNLLRSAALSSFGWAKGVLASVNERGQARLTAGTDPRVARMMTELDQAADAVQLRARPILDGFSARVEAILAQLAGESATASGQAAQPSDEAHGIALEETPVAEAADEVGTKTEADASAKVEKPKRARKKAAPPSADAD